MVAYEMINPNKIIREYQRIFDRYDNRTYCRLPFLQFLSGNSDKDTVVTHELDVPVLGRYIRLNVVDFKKNGQSNYVGMRVELYGCSSARAG